MSTASRSPAAARTLRNNGTMSITEVGNLEPDTQEVVAEWTLVPIEVADAARFEVMVAAPSWVEGGLSASALNTWLNLGTERSWTTAGPRFSSTIRASHCR